MKIQLWFLGIFVPVLTVFDTILVGQTTYMDLRIGQFKKIELPYNFSQYYSITAGHSEASTHNSLPDVCQVQQRELKLEQLDYVSSRGKQLGYRDVVTAYESIVQRRLMIDMYVEGTLLYVAYTNSIVIYQLNLANEKVGEISNKFKLVKQLRTGKFLKSQDKVYFAGQNIIYSISKDGLEQLTGYEEIQDFQSVVMSGKNTVIITAGKSGIIVYNITENSVNLLMSLDSIFFNSSIDFCGLQVSQDTIYLLDRVGGLFLLYLNLSNSSQSTLTLTNFTNSGCENLQISHPYIYITCPQLHKIDISSQTYTQKVYENPLFKVRSIVIFDDFVVVIGHNLAKVYYQGILLGYYHEYVMRRVIAINGKFLLGNDHGISFSQLNLNEPKITCGLKRKKMIENFEGQTSTTINVVAECSKEYFQLNNIKYTEELQNDTCMYHFPVSINLWIGKEINYLPFKIGISIIAIACLGILVGWFLLNSRIKKLNNVLKNYVHISQTTESKIKYQNMVEEPHEDPAIPEGTKASGQNEVQMHDIGD